jgi:hypothetical protein
MRQSQIFYSVVVLAISFCTSGTLAQNIESQEALFKLVSTEKTASKKLEKISRIYEEAKNSDSKIMKTDVAIKVIGWGSPLVWASDFIKEGKPCSELKSFLWAGSAPNIEEEKDLPQELKNSINFMAKICQDYALRK